MKVLVLPDIPGEKRIAYTIHEYPFSSRTSMMIEISLVSNLNSSQHIIQHNFSEAFEYSRHIGMSNSSCVLIL